MAKSKNTPATATVARGRKPGSVNTPKPGVVLFKTLEKDGSLIVSKPVTLKSVLSTADGTEYTLSNGDTVKSLESFTTLAALRKLLVNFG